jgi:hypothetical protein
MPGQKQIVLIEYGDQISGGCPDPNIEGTRRSSAVPAKAYQLYRGIEIARRALRDCRALVSRRVVDNDDLLRLARLAKDGFERLSKKAGTVVSCQNHGNRSHRDASGKFGGRARRTTLLQAFAALDMGRVQCTNRQSQVRWEPPCGAN